MLAKIREKRNRRDRTPPAQQQAAPGAIGYGTVGAVGYGTGGYDYLSTLGKQRHTSPPKPYVKDEQPVVVEEEKPRPKRKFTENVSSEKVVLRLRNFGLNFNTLFIYPSYLVHRATEGTKFSPCPKTVPGSPTNTGKETVLGG